MNGDQVDFGNEPGLIDPSDTGGSPVVMPNNDDWFKLGSQVVSTVRDIVVARQGGLAAPSGTLSSNVRNFPPGQAGKNVQAASTAGGQIQPFASQVNARNLGLLVAVAALLAALVLLRRKA
jgi:hypothetical protein